jgi:hypothetical protein
MKQFTLLAAIALVRGEVISAAVFGGLVWLIGRAFRYILAGR